MWSNRENRNVHRVWTQVCIDFAPAQSHGVHGAVSTLCGPWSVKRTVITFKNIPNLHTHEKSVNEVP